MKRCWASILHSTGLASRSCRHGANRPNIYNFQKKTCDPSTCYFGFKIHTQVAWVHFQIKPPSMILCRCNWAHVWIGQLVLMNIRPVLDLYWYQHWTSPNVLLRSTILYESWIIHVFELWTSSHLIYVYQHWTFPHVLLRHTILYESSSFNGHSIHIYEHWTSPCATAVGHIFSVSEPNTHHHHHLAHLDMRMLKSVTAEHCHIVQISKWWMSISTCHDENKRTYFTSCSCQ